jgi:hypothetical protein
MAAKLTRLTHKIAIQMHLAHRAVPFAVLSPGGQSGNFWIHPRKFITCHQNAGQNHYIKTANNFFENVAKLKHLETTIIDQHYINKEIKRRLHLGNVYYHSVKNHPL